MLPYGPAQVRPPSNAAAAASAPSDYRSSSADLRLAGNRTNAAALENAHDAADHAAIVCSLDAAHIRRQMRLDPNLFFIAQPEQIAAHEFSPKTNQYRNVPGGKD
jgi:hypothetical protein